MAKSQKKITALNEKSSVIHKPGRGIQIPPVKNTKPNNIRPKTAAHATQTPEKSTGDSKQSKILALLQRPAGATVDDMAKATGWQRHSVHGMMSGVLRKRLGLNITSDKEDHGRVYRITGNVSRL